MMNLNAPHTAAQPLTDIQAVLFDLDGTLRNSHPSAHEVFYHFAWQAGAVVGRKAWRQALYWAHAYWANSPELFEDIDQWGKFSVEFWDNYGRRYLQAFGCAEDIVTRVTPQLTTYFTEQYKPLNMVPPDAVETLEALHAAGLTLGVVTNREKPCDDELEKLGLRRYFDFTLAAGQVNAWKPDPAIFAHALEQSGSVPGRTLYLGDNFFTDILGAQQAGLQPVLIDPEKVFPDAPCPVITQLADLLPLVLHG